MISNPNGLHSNLTQNFETQPEVGVHAESSQGGATGQNASERKQRLLARHSRKKGTLSQNAHPALAPTLAPASQAREFVSQFVGPFVGVNQEGQKLIPPVAVNRFII